MSPTSTDLSPGAATAADRLTRSPFPLSPDWPVEARMPEPAPARWRRSSPVLCVAAGVAVTTVYVGLPLVLAVKALTGHLTGALVLVATVLAVFTVIVHGIMVRTCGEVIG